MNSYPIRIVFKDGHTEKRKPMTAKSFKVACHRTKIRFRNQIKHGHDVQIFNPGEKSTLPQSQYIGQF